jgi:hypothetical protein
MISKGGQIQNLFHEEVCDEMLYSYQVLRQHPIPHYHYRKLHGLKYILCVHFCQDSIATTVDCSLIKMKLVTEVVLLIYLHLIIDILPLNIHYE